MVRYSRKRSWRIAAVALWPFVVLGAALCYYTQISGFSPSKIFSPLRYHEEWDVEDVSSSSQEEVNCILAQKFFYLGENAKSYSFVSEDGMYVLKFFKMHRMLAKNWLNYIPIPRILDRYRFEKIDKKNFHIFHSFMSCKIAYEELCPQTGLVFVHLNKTRKLLKKLQVCDQGGKLHQVDLDNTEFIVQRRMEKVADRIDLFIHRGDYEGVRKILKQVLQLTVFSVKRGIINKEEKISIKYGMLNDSVVFKSLWGFSKEENLDTALSQELEVQYEIARFEEWLKEEYPEIGSLEKLGVNRVAMVHLSLP